MGNITKVDYKKINGQTGTHSHSIIFDNMIYEHVRSSHCFRRLFNVPQKTSWKVKWNINA